MATSQPGFWIRGIEPSDDPAWKMISSSGKLEFWGKVSDLAAKAFDGQLAAGLDKDGNPLAEISEATRQARKNPDYSPMGRASPNAPALTPVYGKSRTRSLVRSKVTYDGVFIYWGFDRHTGQSWGVILGYHAKGAVRGGKVRNVFGLSPAGTALVKNESRAWWESNRGRLVGRKLFSGILGGKPVTPRDVTPRGARDLPPPPPMPPRQPAPFVTPPPRPKVTVRQPEPAAPTNIAQPVQLPPPPQRPMGIAARVRVKVQQVVLHVVRAFGPRYASVGGKRFHGPIISRDGLIEAPSNGRPDIYNSGYLD